MTPEKIKSMRASSYLLPDPGGEVVRELLDEVERLQKPEARTARLMSSNGEVLFDTDSGLALEIVNYDDDPVLSGIDKVDVDEWRRRYPGEDMEGEHDILDFGYWYRESEGFMTEFKYEPPCEAWRIEREDMIADEKKENPE